MAEYRARPAGKKNLTHGYNGYHAGCRCEKCTKANTAYYRGKRDVEKNLRTIKLHETEFEAVLLALGYATGAAYKRNRALAHTFVWAANAFIRGNPVWRVYDLPPNLKPEQVIGKFMANLEKKPIAKWERVKLDPQDWTTAVKITKKKTPQKGKR